MSDSTTIYRDLWINVRQCPQCCADLDAVLLIGAASNGIMVQYDCPHCGAGGTRPVYMGAPETLVAEYRRLVDVAEAHAETALGKLSDAEAERNWALAQRDEARALVEALLDAGDWYHGHGDHLEGYIDVCLPCGMVDGHDPTCAVGRAEAALAAWKGGGDE